ncbi:hypothetical protein WMY93_030866 [Mugilogobius chulae]|uniref:Uncharacterized protein n=1 Tax=Mugilogobius chulae TaxID=88201 RepID=A0AAW0MFU3_9GOBI
MRQGGTKGTKELQEERRESARGLGKKTAFDAFEVMPGSYANILLVCDEAQDHFSPAKTALHCGHCDGISHV